MTHSICFVFLNSSTYIKKISNQKYQLRPQCSKYNTKVISLFSNIHVFTLYKAVHNLSFLKITFTLATIRPVLLSLHFE